MMTPDQRHAVDTAHGATMRMLNNGNDAASEFLRIEAMQVPVERRSQFLLDALAAAVLEHTATLRAMQERGFIESAADVMSTSARLRDAALDADQQDPDPDNQP